MLYCILVIAEVMLMGIVWMLGVRSGAKEMLRIIIERRDQSQVDGSDD